MTEASNDRGGAALIVEDDPVQIKIIQAMTNQLDVETVMATNVNEALRLLRDTSIEWILLDLKLGEEFGLDLLRNLGAIQPPRSVILVSGCDKKTQAAAMRLAQTQGVHVAGSLSKPINRDELGRLLKQRTPNHPLQSSQREPAAVCAADLASAIEAGEIVPLYQPKISLSSGIPIGVEALARWPSPKMGNISADVFIPLAESSGQIRSLTEIVLRKALEACARWTDEFPHLSLSVAVNVSPLAIDWALLAFVGTVLKETGVPASRLVLEITEGNDLGNSFEVSDVLTRLRIIGVQLSIDDFGTGYASLLSLFRMPFNELKLDRAFVSSASSDVDADRMLRSIVRMAHEMGLRTIAEGIETEDALRCLQDYGCDAGQGWLWAPALTENNLVQWLRSGVGGWVPAGYDGGRCVPALPGH
ncbi:two-component system response regulator [Paraburkholderia lycopersici]|uniref:EAL domain, c-di-GMP-specific phosphodiesterase class I (Or its enzymatically inactive variant) n=1 Tax=Paraburkholderia lycopersici TaxID=416944 RepID=A0A1G6HF46_9BURK|nr:EAL domain-containing response regulator [Paraburkholderia lycopersici]SDB92738.1 EAL domain, c-di-GMP-specific phosphodiesterase class I (or its enzymatically inactive variant) [Paraburkholderia lycopersici]